MTKTIEDIRIYVACLASYNNGILHGRWIDAAQGVDGMQDAINAMLEASPIEDAEEWAIHDYEGFGSIRLSEYAGLESVAELAEFIGENSDLGVAVHEYYSDLHEARTALTDQYIGAYSSVEDFAQEITEDSGEIPERLQYYIDYERMARDMLICDIIAFELSHDEVHLFWQR